MINRTWTTIDGRDAFNISVAGDGKESVEAEAKLALARAVSEVEKAGFAKAHIVRSRLFALDSATRQAASDVRRATLVGDLRGGSSSFVDAERMPRGSRVIMELTAVSPLAAEAKKTVREYEPVIAPPMFVTLDGLVFLSGNTDESATFETQLDAIRHKIDASLAVAGTHISKAVVISAFMSKKVNVVDGRKAIAARFAAAGCPINLTTVEGYSAATKRIEIEVTARA